MRTLYEKSEIWFAVIWIIIYVIVMGTLRGNLGDESLYSAIGLMAVVGVLLTFVLKNGLREKYGFIKPRGTAAQYLFYIPMVIVSTLNLWFSIGSEHSGTELLFGVATMAFAGIVEELIFRGLLFKAMLREGRPVTAIAVSALTFGIGHIVNLFTGQATIDTFVQMIFACAFGFAVTMLFYRSGSIIACIITHSAVDISSKFNSGEVNGTREYIAVGMVTLILVGYGIYLTHMKTSKEV